MKWGLLGVRLGIIGVGIVITVIILMSIIPLAMGGLEIDMDDSQEPEWSVKNGVITLTQKLSVYNGGFYDIEDFTFRFVLEDDMGNIIADSYNRPVDIPAGKTTDISIIIRMDLNAMGEEGLRNMVFNGTNLDALLELETHYMMRLMKMGVTLSEEFQWDPMISDYGIEGNVYHQYNGTAIDLIVPFYIAASDMLDGNMVNLHCTLRNETTVLGTSQKSIPLYGYTSGQFIFPLDEAASQYLLNNHETLIIDMTVEFEGAESSSTFHYYWSPPGGWW